MSMSERKIIWDSINHLIDDMPGDKHSKLVSLIKQLDRTEWIGIGDAILSDCYMFTRTDSLTISLDYESEEGLILDLAAFQTIKDSYE